MTDSSPERPSAYPSLGPAILLVLALLAAQLVLGVATDIIHGADSFPWFGLLVSTVIAFGVAISIGLQVGRLSLNEIAALRPVNDGVWIPLAILLAGLTIILSEIDNALRSVWPMPQDLIDIYLQLSETWLAFAFLGVVIAPITEELLFRGLILRGLLRHYPANKAVLLSALMFAFVHLNPWQFTGAFVFGILSGFLYLWTGSLIPCLASHAIFNAYGIVVGTLLPPIPGFNAGDLVTVEFQPWWFNLIGVVLAAIGLIFLLEHFQLKLGRSDPAGREQEPELP